MPRRLDMLSKRQSRRVAAWIYAVVNPIVDSLQREIPLLDSGNLTWRPHTGRCEIIRTIQEYVDPAQWPNYQTFLAEHSKSAFVPGFKHHDSILESVNNAAQALFDRLISWSDFLKAIDSELRNYERETVLQGARMAWPDYVRNDIARYSAEYVINNMQALPSHYMTSGFWNSSGMKLLAFRSRPEFAGVHRFRERLKELSAKLERALVTYRLAMSREYDVPAAPVPGLSLEE